MASAAQGPFAPKGPFALGINGSVRRCVLDIASSHSFVDIRLLAGMPLDGIFDGHVKVLQTSDGPVRCLGTVGLRLRTDREGIVLEGEFYIAVKGELPRGADVWLGFNVGLDILMKSFEKDD